MKTLRFRAPGTSESLERLLARAWPQGSRSQVQSLVKGGRVRIAGVIAKNIAAGVPPGSEVTANVGAGKRSPKNRPVDVVLRGEDFVVVNKPAGYPCHAGRAGQLDARALVAQTLDVNPEELWPVHRLDADVSGVWLIATSKVAAGRLGKRFEGGQVTKAYRAIIPVPHWPDGTLRKPIDGKAAETRFSIAESRGEICQVEIDLVTGRTHQIRRHFEALGTPIIGDALYGGRLVRGGLRLQSAKLAIPEEGIDASVPEPDSFWPTESVFPSHSKSAVLHVSAATIKAIRKGHPWVLTDTETGDAEQYQSGTVVRLEDSKGRRGGYVLTEGRGRVAARLWQSQGDEKPDSIEARVAKALSKRRDLLANLDETNSFRLIHGEADGLPGLHIDLLGATLRLLVTSRCALGTKDRALNAVRGQLAGIVPTDGPVVQTAHLSACPDGELRATTLLSGSASEPYKREVRERGLSYAVDLGLDEPYRSRPGIGLFIDQRANRDRMARVAEGGRWLNLFCHTGAFSVAALAAGASEVISVDLSQPYLDWLEENLKLNGQENAAHTSVRKDVRRYLAQLEPDDRFDGVIVDPPTAATAGKSFWSVKRDGAGLIRDVLLRLRPGGYMLACRNDRGSRSRLLETVKREADDLGIVLRRAENAPPGPDFPRLKGFPEGDAFEGVWVQLSP